MCSLKEDVSEVDSLSLSYKDLKLKESPFNLDANVISKDNPTKVIQDEGKGLSNIDYMNANHHNSLICSPDKSSSNTAPYKTPENGNTKAEKRRSVAVARNEPPPLIHYLQDKDLPKVDNDNSPPQLLPEVIVTRTKLQKEKGQTSLEENSFKISVHKNFLKLKRKSWLRYSYSSSLSDDQASNESQEHLLHMDTFQSGSSTSGCKRGLNSSSEKYKKSKQNINWGKTNKMDSTSETVGISPKIVSGNESFSGSLDLEENYDKVPGELKLGCEKNYEMYETDKESLLDMKNDVDFESWITETEDEDDIFNVPQRVSTGKEERDTIDGIEFLGFETEHDMVEFTKIELDFQGGALHEENVAHSDDGLDMMDDSFTYSEPETQAVTQAIIPTKTKDITKIKGWRTKNFAINNNPSDGQGSSSSVGPYEDDDGFASCDIKIEEDVSLDVEEQSDLWSGGEHDLFVHDDEFPLEKYSSEESLKKSNAKAVKEISTFKTEKRTPEKAIYFAEKDHVDELSQRETHECNNCEDIIKNTARYPKRHSVTSKLFNSTSKKSETSSKPSVDDQPQITRRRGRRPKTLAEKRLMIQLANQYKRRRKRGRPKGSKNKTYKILNKSSTGTAYNLRNSSRKESNVPASTFSNISCNVNKTYDTTVIIKEELLGDSQAEQLSSEKQPRKFDKEYSGEDNVSSSVKVKEEPPDFEDYGSCERYKMDAAEGNAIHTLLNSESDISCSYATTTLTTNTDPITAITSHPETICSSSISNRILNSPTRSSLASHYISNIPMSIPPVGATLSSTFISSDLANIDNTSSVFNGSVLQDIEEKGEIKQKVSSESVVSIVNKSDKIFEYGLVLSTGIGRPVVALAMEQLKVLRKNNNKIDEHWARFAASVVVTRKQTLTTPQTNTIVLPVRAVSLPFTSYSHNRNSQTPHLASTADKTPQISQPPKFAPLFGSSVRFRCPRPLSQVGVRTLPRIIRPKNFNHLSASRNCDLGQSQKSDTSNKYVSEKDNGRNRLSSKYICNDIDDEIRKVVDDIVKYVERREAHDLIIPEDPHNISRVSESSPVFENVVTKKKKGPMIRELNRLDVNVIEMWDAKNKECTEEYCKLGCVCESLECCKPAIEEHCGKEECMFNCECEPQSFRRGDNRQHMLLSPLSLLNIPQQTRRILAKEEKEFQQTVIRAKHETIVVGSSGSSRRKREIKLPGRYRDSYVALGKEYGLVDFKISSDEIAEPPAKRQTKLSLISNKDKETVSLPTQKNSPVSLKMTWDSKIVELKQKHDIKKCSVKLERISNLKMKNSDFSEASVSDLSSKSPVKWHVSYPKNIDSVGASSSVQKSGTKSRNMAVKSTTPRPYSWYDMSRFSARTAPVNINLFRKYKCGFEYQERNEFHRDELGSSQESSAPIGVSIASEENDPRNDTNNPQSKICNSISSDLVIDNCTEGFGKIESVTTLSEEQFQKGDFGFGIEQFVNEADVIPIISEGTKPNISPQPDKNTKGKISSNLSINKIATLLNRRIRELKETGGKISFPSPGNEESIHLLPWPALKSLFQDEDIQLWYHKCGSKLVITSNKIPPGVSYVNLNDISPIEYKLLPPIISNLFDIGRGRKLMNNPNIYALLHFDGRHVELVGTIYKNQTVSPGEAEQCQNFDKVSELSTNTFKHNLSSVKNSSSEQILGGKEEQCQTKSVIPESLVNNSHTEITITEVRDVCKSNESKSVGSDSLNKKLNLAQTSNELIQDDKSLVVIQSTSDVCNASKSFSINTEKKNETTVVKRNVNFETRVRTFKSILQSTKIETSTGENVRVPLPTCVMDSKWYVLSMEKAFDVLQVKKKCSVRHRHVAESIKMALKHCKTVRLPLQLPKKGHENPYQPKFGVYAVPCISSFVFIGPYNLNDDSGVATLVAQDGELVHSNDINCMQSIESIDNTDKNPTNTIVDILKKVLSSSIKGGMTEPWLFAKRTSDTQGNYPPGNLSANTSYVKVGKDVFFKSCMKNVGGISTNNPENNDDPEICIIKSVRNTDVNKEKETDPKCISSSKVEPELLPVTTTKLVPSDSNNQKSERSVKINEIKRNPQSNAKRNLSGNIHPKSSPSSSRSPAQKKHTISTLLKSSNESSHSKSKLPVPFSGWLVPSSSWIGCISCNFDPIGGLSFSHPIYGSKMAFKNLESAQLWLDRLMQSAILYIPRHLFITWTLKLDSSEEGIKLFDSTILQGGYMMSSKGVFEIDKLIPMEAEKYGLKPIEILRLQDKKRRRDLELGFFQLRRALQENGCENFSSKTDLLTKAIDNISHTKLKARGLEKERKKWRSTKHKSLLHLYHMMRVLPIQMKRNIVQKLKRQYDQADALVTTESQEPVLNDEFTFSMSRYCGNSLIFGPKNDESDVEDYLSECNEECDEGLEKPPEPLSSVIHPVNERPKELKLAARKDILIKGQDDDESVSISLVIDSSQTALQSQTINNSDDITVTCLNEPNDSGKPLNVSVLTQVTSLKDTGLLKRKRGSENLQGSLLLQPSQVVSNSLHNPRSEKVLPSMKKHEGKPPTTDMKIIGSCTRGVVEDVTKRFKSDSIQVTPVRSSKILETANMNSTFEKRTMKHYKTIKIDSPKLASDSSLISTDSGASSTRNRKNINAVSINSTSSNTLFVNVISPKPKQIVPMHVEKSSSTTSYSSLCVPPGKGSVTLPSSSLKFIHSDVKKVLKTQSDPVPVLVKNQLPTTRIQTKRVLSPVKVESARTLIAVKSFAKDSISSGAESTKFLPSLMPFIDGKLKTQISANKTLHKRYKTIAPMPTLFPIADGVATDVTYDSNC